MAWPLENKNKLSKSCIDPLNIQLCYSKNNFGFNVTSEKIQKWKGEYLHWSNKIQSDVDPQIFIITSLSVLFHFQSRLKLPSEFIIKIKLKSLISSSYENQVFNLVNLSTWCFFYIIQDSNNIAEHFCSDSLPAPGLITQTHCLKPLCGAVQSTGPVGSSVCPRSFYKMCVSLPFWDSQIKWKH